jgi:hypothetical protein
MGKDAIVFESQSVREYIVLRLELMSRNVVSSIL